MEKIVLYSSNQVNKIPLTGGVRRFRELADHLGDYCSLVVMTGDEIFNVPQGTSHVSTHQQIVLTTEKELARHNRKYLKSLKKNSYDWIIAFDVPPAFWLALYRIPHLCLMVRKDLIGYEKISLDARKIFGIKRFAMLSAFSLAELLTMLYAEKIIVQCEYDKNELIKRHRLFKYNISRKTSVQINNVNPSWAQESAIEKTPDNNLFKVGTVNGFADLRKGCDIFLEAVSALIDEGVPVEGYIAGDGEPLQFYKKNIKVMLESTFPDEYPTRQII